MPNPNYTVQWPLYKDSGGIYIRALPIASIVYANDGSGLVSFDGAYNDQYISAAFAATFKPQVGGYLFNSQHGEILYLSKADFEAKYTADNDDKGPKGDKGDTGATGPAGPAGPAYTLTSATSSALGGVKQGAAVANIGTQTATDFPTSQTAINNVAAKLNDTLAQLRAAGVIAQS